MIIKKTIIERCKDAWEYYFPAGQDIVKKVENSNAKTCDDGCHYEGLPIIKLNEGVAAFSASSDFFFIRSVIDSPLRLQSLKLG